MKMLFWRWWGGGGCTEEFCPLLKMLFWGWGGCTQGFCPLLCRCRRHPFQSFSLEVVSTRVAVVVVVVVAQYDCLPTLVRMPQA